MEAFFMPPEYREPTTADFRHTLSALHDDACGKHQLTKDLVLWTHPHAVSLDVDGVWRASDLQQISLPGPLMLTRGTITKPQPLRAGDMEFLLSCVKPNRSGQHLLYLIKADIGNRFA